MNVRAHWVMGGAVVLLLAAGLTVLASAGTENSLRHHGDAGFFFRRQLIWTVPAVAAWAAAYFFDYRKWRDCFGLTVLAGLAVAGLMVAVLFTDEVKGSRRWLDLGVARVQPSEFAKLALVIVTAAVAEKLRWRIEKFWKGAVPLALPAVALAALAVLEPDYGAGMIMCIGAAAVWLVAGMKIVHIFMLGGAGAVGAAVKFFMDPNRRYRIAAWLPDAWAEKLDLAKTAERSADALHQVNQSMWAFYQGGVFGKGFNASMQKQQYLPEAHTDFIFAVGAEEWGMIFSLAAMALYATVFVCGLRIAKGSQDKLGRSIAYGTSVLLFFNVVFNLAVVCGAAPTKGVALPFFSYGGTNLVAAMMAVGVVMSVGRVSGDGLQTVRARSKIPSVFSNQGV